MTDATMSKFLITVLLLSPGVSFGRSLSMSAEEVFDAYKSAMKQSLLRRGKVAYKAEGTMGTKFPSRYKRPETGTAAKRSIFVDGARIHVRKGWNVVEDGHSKIRIRECLLTTEHSFAATHGVPPYMIVANKRQRRREALLALSWVELAFEGYMLVDYDAKPLWEVIEDASVSPKLRKDLELIDGHETYVLEFKTPNRGHYTLWVDPNCGFNLRRCVLRLTGSDLFLGKPLSTPRELPPPRQATDFTRFLRLPRKIWTKTLDSVKIENIDGFFVPVEGRVTNINVHSNGEELIYVATNRLTEIDLNPDFDKYENPFVLGVPDGTRVIYEDLEGAGVPYLWVDGKMVADVDDLVIAELDKTAQQIIADGDVPPKLGSFKKTDANDQEPNTVIETDANVAESKPEVLAESNGLSIVVMILIGLAIIGVAGVLVFRKLKA